jgi:uncharacterized protein (DUF697 family)/tellurite resistance protein
MANVSTSTIQENVNEKFLLALNSVITEREKYYIKNPAPSVTAIDAIIKSYSITNAAVSGGIGLIPGPWGIAAAVPEIIAIIRNQIAMIYDIGKAYGKTDEILCRETILGIFASASGSAGIGLISIHGSKIIVKRASLRIIQKIIAILGGKVTQKMIKSIVSKFFPLAGAAAMATWSKMTTHSLGKNAKEMFSKEIVIEESEEIDDIKVIPEETEKIDFSNEIKKNKIYALSNLMKIDNKVEDSEIDLIDKIIVELEFSDSEALELTEKIHSSEKISVNYDLFKTDQDEAFGLIMNLISLAKIDGEFHKIEKVYISRIAKTLGFTDEEIKDLINE